MAKKPPKLKSKDEQKSTIMEESDALDNLLNAAQGAADSAPDNDDEEDTTTNDDDVTTNEDFIEEKPEETKPVNVNTGITVSAPKHIPTKETSVDIATVADHSCFIGGIPYHFKKGVKTQVPRPVKDILRNAGLLMPL